MISEQESMYQLGDFHLRAQLSIGDRLSLSTLLVIEFDAGASVMKMQKKVSHFCEIVSEIILKMNEKHSEPGSET